MKHYHDIITNPTTTAERCRFLRQRIQWSLSELAYSFGFTRPVVSYLENGHRPPSRKLMEMYAGFFGCSFDWLMKGEGEPPPINPKHSEQRPMEALQALAQQRAARRQAKLLGEDDLAEMMEESEAFLEKPTC